MQLALTDSIGTDTRELIAFQSTQLTELQRIEAQVEEVRMDRLLQDQGVSCLLIMLLLESTVVF